MLLVPNQERGKERKQDRKVTILLLLLFHQSESGGNKTYVAALAQF